MLNENNLYEILVHRDIRVVDLTKRLRPLEKLGKNIDMVGKWLIKNTNRIKTVEQQITTLQKQVDQQNDVIEWLSHRGTEPTSALALQQQLTILDHRTEGMMELVGQVNFHSDVVIALQRQIDKLEYIIKIQNKTINVINYHLTLIDRDISVSPAERDILEAMRSDIAKFI